jgi:hypothetical protein
VEVLFLLVGLVFIALAAALIVSDIRAGRGTVSVPAKVIGFSNGRKNSIKGHSFHSVAEYVGPDGRKYYIEGAFGSSVPLHAVGDVVTVLVSRTQPEQAILKSALTFTLACILGLLGLASVFVFWVTFKTNLYSAITALVVLGGLGLKVQKAWRSKPLSKVEWQDYKKRIFSPRVFTAESKDQISWADPMRLDAAVGTYEKSQRLAVPFLFVAGLGLMIASHHFYVKTHAFLENAVHTSGRVVGLREKDSGDGPSTYAAVVEYEYPSGRKSEFVDSFSSSPPWYRTGQTVGVLYSRDNPAEAQIDRGRLNYWLSALLGFPGALFVVLGYFSAKRRRNLRADQP